MMTKTRAAFANCFMEFPIMKTSLRSLAFILVLSNFVAYGGVTKEQLGKLLLEENYSIVTQDYLAYYAQGPTSATTYGGYHPGIDYRATTGRTVYSPVSGVVKSTAASNGRISILIDGTSDYFIFLHLSRFSVGVNSRVQVGDTIGLTGSAGASSPHLHVEVRTNNQLAAYYFKSRTATGVNKNPTGSVTLDDKNKMTYVFNMLEKNYSAYFPVTQRYGNTTYFDSGNGYRSYSNSRNNYLYLWNGTLWYRIDGQWTDSKSSINDWYYGWGGL